MSVMYFFQDTFDSTKTNLWTNIMHTFKWHTDPLSIKVTYLRDICPVLWIFCYHCGYWWPDVLAVCIYGHTRRWFWCQNKCFSELNFYINEKRKIQWVLTFKMADEISRFSLCSNDSYVGSAVIAMAIRWYHHNKKSFRLIPNRNYFLEWIHYTRNVVDRDCNCHLFIILTKQVYWLC